jgi:hypothetical protein
VTVSRSGKRGKPSMVPESRNRRVVRNAGLKSIARPGLAFSGRESWSYVIGRSNDWAADERPADQNDNVAPLALAHGRYEVADSIFKRSDSETEIAARVVNRTVTVIDGWIDEDVFIRPHVRVIEYARDLWRDIRMPRHPFFEGYDPEDRNDSFESERAKALLHRCRRLVGDYRWNIFENVVRWNEPTGIPGSRVSTLSEASIGAAQQIVREVAEDIRVIL